MKAARYGKIKERGDPNTKNDQAIIKIATL
jgi:hypothetical protein